MAQRPDAGTALLPPALPAGGSVSVISSPVITGSGYAFLVDAKTFAWLMPFAVIGLPAAMAIYIGLGLALARLLWTRGALADSHTRRDADDCRMVARVMS